MNEKCACNCPMNINSECTAPCEKYRASHTSATAQPTLYKTQIDDDGAIGKVAICLCDQCKMNGFLCTKSPRAIGVMQPTEAQQRVDAAIKMLQGTCGKLSKGGQANLATELVEAIALLQAGGGK